MDKIIYLINGLDCTKEEFFEKLGMVSRQAIMALQAGISVEVKGNIFQVKWD